jgi:Spy/CpxP family protein refolding chaperone
MKKLITSISLILLVATTVMAQKTNGKQKLNSDNMHKGADKMHKGSLALKQLNLDETQKQKMNQINENFKTEMKALHALENITVKEQRDRKAQLIKTHKEQIKQILTAEQLLKMDELKIGSKQKHPQHKGDRLLKMKTRLQLSDEQYNSIKKENEAYTTKIKAIKANDQLDRNAKTTQIKAIHEQMKANLEKHLTKEQNALLNKQHQVK